MNIANPYAPRRKPRHRQRRRLLLLTSICAIVLATVLILAGCNPPEDATTPHTRPVAANPEDSRMITLASSTRPHSAADEFHAWYTASERNAVWFHIRDEFGMGTLGDQAVRVAECESGLNPRARSRTNDHGVFQINAPSWRDRFARVTGMAWSPNVYHASYNTAFARWLVDETGGWSHWTCRP